MELINNSIKHSVCIIRNLLFKSHDESLKKIIDNLKLVKGIRWYEEKKHDQIVFTLPLTDVRTWICYTGKEGFSFLDLLEQAKDKTVDTILTSYSNSKEKDSSFKSDKGVKMLCGGGTNLADSASASASASTSLSSSEFNCGDNIENLCEKEAILLDTFKDDEVVEDYSNFERDPFDGGEIGIDGENSKIRRKVKIKNNDEKGKSKGKGKGKDVLKGKEKVKVKSIKEPLADFSPFPLNKDRQDSILTKFGISPTEDIIGLLQIFLLAGLKTDPNTLTTWVQATQNKARVRKTLNFENNSISFSIIKNTYIICHYSPADLSMLRDFDEIKDMLGTVKKVFVTLGKPLLYEHANVYVRDTFLLAPGTSNSLEKIGKIYEKEGNYEKIEVSIEDKMKMSNLLARDPEKFEKYAIRDAEITLKHAVVMAQFNEGIKQLGVPLTLSSVGRYYVFDDWRKRFSPHLPYQMSGEYPMGDPGQSFTPKALSATGLAGTYMPFFINNYKGGRNESFMYGIDRNTILYDYDLSSAYTTAMADMNLPNYHSCRLIKRDDLLE